jgi:hypothetical protein
MQYYNGARTTSISEQGRAGTTRCSGRQAYSANTNSWRITPPVCSDFISDREDRARDMLNWAQLEDSALQQKDWAAPQWVAGQLRDDVEGRKKRGIARAIGCVGKRDGG